MAAKTAGQMCRDVRLASGLSQRLAAEAAGMNQVALLRIERSEESHLPLDVVDRLANVYAQLGIPRDYLRRVAPPGSYRPVKADTLPELRPAILSSFERAAIRRKIKSWIDERCYEAYYEILERAAPLKKNIVERFCQQHAGAEEFQSYYLEADIAVVAAIDKLPPGADLEAHLRDAIERQLNEYHRNYAGTIRIGQRRVSHLQNWQRHAVTRTSSASIRRPKLPDTVPVFACRSIAEGVVAIDFEQAVDKFMRPSSLLERRSVYGIRVPDEVMNPYYAADDLVVLEAICQTPRKKEVALISTLSEQDSDLVVSTFSLAEAYGHSDIQFEPCTGGPEQTISVARARLHRILKPQELL